MSTTDAPTDSAGAAMTTDVKEFARLAARKAELKAELKDVQEAMTALEARLLTAFEETGISRLRVDGRTVYVRRELWASAADDRESAIDALRQAGLDDLVKENFNTRTLSSYVREMEAQGLPLPESFDGAIKVTEKFSVQSRKS